MSYKESDIVYETANFWVLNRHSKGFEVLKIGATHSTVVGVIGYQGDRGMKRAIQECIKRQDQIK